MALTIGRLQAQPEPKALEGMAKALEGMTKAELAAHAQDLGIEVSGTKADMIAAIEAEDDGDDA